MTQAIATPQFTCPGCGRLLAPLQWGRVRCECGWRGEAYLFTPRAMDVAVAEMALPDDATCIHHPRKKATAVCAGTGDYICSLCAIDLNGKTYSAEYLNSADNKKVIGDAFDSKLARPDSRIVLYIALLIVPYIGFISAAFAFLWIPHSFFLYAKALRMRRENPVYHRVVGTGRLIALPILLVLLSVGWLAGVIALIALIARGRPF